MNAEDAFSPTQDRSHFFASSVANVVLAQLQQGLDHDRPILVVTGEADVGKSSVVREACARWGARVRAEWLATPGPAPEALLAQVVRAFGGQARGDDSRSGWLAALSRTLGIVLEQDQTPLLIVEDVHTLSAEALVELAAIHAAATEAKRDLRMILLGLPQLHERLDDLALDLLMQLVAVRCQLMPLPAFDVRHYLHHRIAAAGGDGERVFSRKSARELHAASRGVPGVLDELAAEAIRCARAAGTVTVGQEHVKAAVATVLRVQDAATSATPAAPAAPAKPAAPKPAAKPAPAPPKPVEAAAPPAEPPAPVAATKEQSETPPAKAPTPPAATAKPARPPRPAPAPPMPFPEAPPLDSGHPRVKEWVSRFTEGDGLTRFGARMQLPPITEPDELPTLEASEPEPPPPPRPARKVARAPEPSPKATVVRTPEPETETVAYTPQPSEPEPIVIVPEPIVLVPEPIVLEPEPIVLESDAVTPLVDSPPPAAPSADPPTSREPQGGARGNRRKRRQRERERAAAPALVPSPPAAASRPVVPAPAATLPTPAPAPALAASAAPPPPRRLIIDESVTQEPPPLPTVEPPQPVRLMTGPRSPAHGRFVQVVVPALLMLGVAAAAIIAGSRGGFEHDAPQKSANRSSSAPSETATPPAGAEHAGPGTGAIDTNDSESIAPDSDAGGVSPSDTRDSDAVAPGDGAPPAFGSPSADGKPKNFCLTVGTYLFSDRAHTIARQLSRRTGYETWVEVVASGGARSYRIMLGGFATETEGEQAADRLLERGIVSEALVHPIRRGRAGQ